MKDLKPSAVQNFDQILLDSVDEAFSSLGDRAKNSIYFHLERKFSIGKHEIPSKLDEFSCALEKILGLGARYLEILAMRKLHEKVECSYKLAGPKRLRPNLTFKMYVELARLSYKAEAKPAVGEMGMIVEAEEYEEQRV